ncbi:MAG: hypothetical protein R6V27_06510 [Balneolaceae bacterium]
MNQSNKSGSLGAPGKQNPEDAINSGSRQELKKLALDLSNGEFKPESEQRKKIMQMLVRRLALIEQRS